MHVRGLPDLWRTNTMHPLSRVFARWGPIWEDGGIVMLVRIGVMDCVLGSGFGREGHWMGVFIVLAYPVFCCC